MRSFRGLIIAGAIVVGTFALAIALGALWLNSFIHSPAFKSEVEKQAAQAVGGPVTIQSIDLDIFRGVQLKGLATQLDANHSGGQGALTVKVASVNCSYSWAELFQRKLRLTGLTLSQPDIVLTKQATPSKSSFATPTAATPSGPIAGSVTGPGGGSVAFQFVLDRAKISDGTITVRDAGGTSLVELKGVNGSADTSGYYDGKDVTGNLKIASATASNMQATSFSTPVTYRANYLEAKPFSASAFDGAIKGGYVYGNSSASVLDLGASGLDVAKLTAATVSSSSAKLSGSLDVQSKWRGIETGDLNGEGDAQMTGGKLAGVKILQEVSAVLKIKELNEPAITKAQTHFVVRDRMIKFIGLQLDSPVLRITGDGTAGFNGALDANLVLILSSSTMARLPKEAAASFVQQADGSGSIAFHVSGTTSDPKTDLATRLLLQNTKVQKAIDKALNKFFH